MEIENRIRENLKKYVSNIKNAAKKAKKVIEDTDIVSEFWDSLEAGYCGTEIYSDPFLIELAEEKKSGLLQICAKKLTDAGLFKYVQPSRLFMDDKGKIIITWVARPFLEELDDQFVRNHVIIHRDLKQIQKRYKEDKIIKLQRQLDTLQSQFDKAQSVIDALELHPVVGPAVEIARKDWEGRV